MHSTSGELFGWPFECNDRNFAGRLLLISSIGGKYFYRSPKRLFSLIAGENPGCGIKFLATNLNRNFRVSQQVEIPLRMFRMASFGRYSMMRSPSVTSIKGAMRGRPVLAPVVVSRINGAQPFTWPPRARNSSITALFRFSQLFINQI